MFQFPNSSIQLPGYTYETDDPNGYGPKEEIVHFIERYAAVMSRHNRAFCINSPSLTRSASTNRRPLVAPTRAELLLAGARGQPQLRIDPGP